MKNNLFHVKLIEAISTKIPQKNKMVTLLTELLGIEREAVYRRLRGEVPFSFNEVATISQRFSLSIDELIDISSSNISHFKLRMLEFDRPNQEDISWMEQLATFIHFINNPTTEACESTNVLPKTFFFQYETLTRFYVFRWFYQYDDSYQSKKYSDISISDKMNEYYKKYVKAAYKVGLTKFILDFNLFSYLANDLYYFRGINLITKEEGENIKRDLLKLLDWLEEITVTGRYPGTQNRVLIYISNLNFESGYSYIKTTSYHISFIRAFLLNGVVSFDQKTFDNIHSWTQSQIKSSTLISESGEMDRIRFFEKQRTIVNGI